jgi:hypothetical protein
MISSSPTRNWKDGYGTTAAMISAERLLRRVYPARAGTSRDVRGVCGVGVGCRSARSSMTIGTIMTRHQTVSIHPNSHSAR